MKESRVRPIVVATLVLVGILMGLHINNKLSKRLVNVEGGSKFDEVMMYVGNDYVDVPDTHKLEDEAIAAMMEELDPHSAYISLEEFNEVNDPLLGYCSAWKKIPSR